MIKRLELIFENQEGRNVTLSLDNPIEPVDPALVAIAMDTILSSDIFTSAGGGFVAKKGARVVARSSEDIAIPLA